MRKVFSLILIIILLGSQFPPSTKGQFINAHQDNFKVIVKPNSTIEQAVINIEEINNKFDRIEVLLPDNVEYSNEMTKKLSGEGIKIEYEKERHKVIAQQKDQDTLNLVLLNFKEQNNILQIRGINEDEAINYEKYSFTIPKAETEDNESSYDVTDERVVELEDFPESKSNRQTKGEIENSLKIDQEKKEQKAKAKTEESKASKITPFAGNLNVDIDISPQKDTILSGYDAVYNLVLKVTGSRAEYPNAKIFVDLPVTNYTAFSQNLSELIIDGVEPLYDENNHQLIYEFDSIKSGRSYETAIKLNTENGVSPNKAELTAQVTFTADNQPEFTDNATVSIDASSAVSVTKKFKEARLSGEVRKAPFPGSFTIWDIKVSVPKKDVGQMFIKDGSKIVIKDTFSNGLTFYDVQNNTPEPSVSGRTLTWEMDAPTFAEQMEADGDFFTIDLRVRLQVNDNTNLVGTTQENNISASVTFIDDKVKTDAAKDSITIVSTEEANGDIEGTWYVPTHVGPLNGKGGIASNDFKNPNPDVYDDAYLGFSHGIAPLEESKPGDFQSYTTIYHIDSNLILNKIKTPERFDYRPNSTFPAGIPLVEQPRYNILASVNGVERVLVEDAKSNREYNRSDLGLDTTDRVEYIKYDFTYAPSGMLNIGRPNYYFNVVKGFTGEVVNAFNVYGRDANGRQFNYSYDTESRDTIAGPRSATIVPRPTDQPPIGQVGVELLDHDGGEVTRGENRMRVRLANTSSSTLTMSEPLETVVLLPLDVTIHDNPDASYTDTDGRTSQGHFKIVDENYNGSGRKLVKIKWNDDRIRIGTDLTAELDVVISDGSPNTLQFDVFGFSGDEVLHVPSTSGESITDTVLQTDEEDLNGDGITEQPRLKSGNIYMIRGQYDIQTEKLVKGELDEAFTYFGHTIPSGTIDYQVKLTNTTGVNISNMTLIDVLPSVGDLGITDNVDRGSQFTPKMTNSIVLPDEWQDKVNVYYSTAKNPERDDLTKNTKYPDTTTRLTNPDGAESPNWLTESEVTDWTNIHSFKIELKDGIEWIKGQDLMIQFSMQAPPETEVEREVLDSSIDPTTRAAWNSFAIATDYGQPVEPLRVGVYMELNNSVQLVKQGEDGETLEGAEFTLFDESDNVIADNLKTDADGLIIVEGLFLGKYKFVETKAPEGYQLNETPLEFEISSSLEQLELSFENSLSTGSVELIKVDETGKTLEGAVFTLEDDEGNVLQENLTTNADGKLLVEDLKPGTYQFVETEAPISYQLDTTPVEFTIEFAQKETVQVEVENKKHTIKISGTKTWKDNENATGDRPESITVQVMHDTDVIDEKKVTSGDDWKFTFTDLPKYNEMGDEIEYTINELPVPGYATEYDGYDIINTKVAKVNVEGTKAWKDDNSDKRPESITVHLSANDKKLKSIDVTADTNWSYAFNDLDAYDVEGVAISYTIAEEPVDGYETRINGYDITNVRKGETSIKVQKTWENDTPDIRPDSITVDLLQNGKVMETVEVSEKSNWIHSFIDLDKYDAEGKMFIYNVQEHEVENYEADIIQTDEGFEITNTLVDKAESDKDKSILLPKTATDYYNLLLIGLIIVTIGTILLLISRKRKNYKN